MPLVLSNAGSVQYVKYKETLSEVLEHSNFDGEDWAVGDRIIFEDGTESRIRQESGGPAYMWDEPVVADLAEVKRAVGVLIAANWGELFATFEE